MKKRYFTRERRTVVNTVEEMQKILNTVKEQCINIFFRKRERNEDIEQNAYIEETESKIKVTFKPGLKAITYVFDRDGEYLIKTTPKDAVSAMSRSFKIQRTEEIMGIPPSSIESAKPLLYKNPKFDGKAVRAYEYDLKEAYEQMLRLPLPNLYTAKYDTKIRKNQVGFYADGEVLKCSFKLGRVCQYVFDLMPSPYIKWLNKLHKQIINAKTAEERLELKSRYRFSIGDLQNLNPFWRCIVVERCNKLIESKMDEFTVYSNTDSIISTRIRSDLFMDKNFVWSLKRCGEIFKWQKGKMNYQWNDEVPAYKGPKKRYIEYYNKTHDKPWDILKDDIPETCKHIYNLDRSTLKIYETE